MLSYNEALTTILDNVAPVGSEQLPLYDAIGMVLAEPVTTPWDLPLWDNSAMDGYAVRSADCRGPSCRLRVTGYLPAGAMAETITVAPGCCVKIMTGAPLPRGADAVVPFEESEETSGEQVTLHGAVTAGQHVRRQGEDIPANETIMQPGTVLRPAELSLLASCGMPMVTVQRRPVAAVLSTGDELVEPGATPGPGQLINSNGIALAAAVREAGGVPRMLGIARDNRPSLLEKLRTGLAADCLITSAGVSAGDRDLVRVILEELGVKFLFWKVAIKPGKPTAFGIFEGKPLFCLPGNPVASQITFEAFVRPALLKMQGHCALLRPTLQATLREPLKGGSRMQFMRVHLVQEGHQYYVRSAGSQETGILRTSLKANAVAMIPPNQLCKAGDTVPVRLLHETLVEA